ncbi:MAG: zinc ribbon domain-containing protein [Methanoregula sp.]|nr:zinc ribbon domain-containing protein [Methanoregula sp.]
MIEVHFATLNEIRWIGVDLNTTGHVAVAADPQSGKILKLGNSIHHIHTQSVNNCTKLWKEGKLWKIKKLKTREGSSFKSALATITRQIVTFAETLGTGIKFEKLFSERYTPHEQNSTSAEFIFDNGSFFAIQRMVERRARKRGIPVMYVNPAYTSKRCCRCGEFGRRSRKRFVCTHCGFVLHADVNAAFNIATTPFRNASPENLIDQDEMRAFRHAKKQMRRRAKADTRHRQEVSPTIGEPLITDRVNRENLIAVLE